MGRVDDQAAACMCDHGADWHSHGGTGDCEHDAKCRCQGFVSPAELEARQNELHLAMLAVESMPAGEAQTACIIKLGERMRRLVVLRGKSEVGRSLDASLG